MDEFDDKEARECLAEIKFSDDACFHCAIIPQNTARLVEL